MPAGVGLIVVPDSFWRGFRLHYGMHVIAAYVGRQQIPAAMRTHALNRLQYDITAGTVQAVWRLIHTFFLEGGACTMLVHDRGSRRIVPTVDGASRVAVQAAAV